MRAAIGMLVLALCLNAGADASGEPVQLTLPRLGGGEVSLGDLRDRWVVLNYWATWCVPCRNEIPDLSELHERRADITVLGLAWEDAGEEAFTAFLEETPAAYPVLLVDVLDPPASLDTPRVLPTTILVRPGGVPVKTFVGPVTGAAVEAFIAAGVAP